MKRLYIDDRWMCVYMLIIEERKRLFCVMYALNWKANLTLNAGEQIGLNPPPHTWVVGVYSLLALIRL